jgi:hypothetical protein
VFGPGGSNQCRQADRVLPLKIDMAYNETNNRNRIRGDQDETFKELNKLGCFGLFVRFCLHPHCSRLH